MGRSREPIVKRSRREGVNLAETPKVQRYLERRPYPPGQHGQRRQRRPSDYSVRLREKQKLRLLYDMREKPFRNLFDEAVAKDAPTGHTFLQLLETRLDNVVFRLGIAHTRRQAKQFISHGHILVDGARTDRPSYRVKPGQEITVAERSRSMDPLRRNIEDARRHRRPAWLEFDSDNLKGKVLHLPAREDITVPVNELLVIEFYSR
ncbi:MAG TPA: 30S ribosomal protein S4 [Trueperaceae bacterium]